MLGMALREIQGGENAGIGCHGRWTACSWPKRPWIIEAKPYISRWSHGSVIIRVVWSQMHEPWMRFQGGVAFRVDYQRLFGGQRRWRIARIEEHCLRSALVEVC